MKRATKSGLAAVAAAALLVTIGGTGGAVAGSLVTSAKIKDGTIRQVDINPTALKAFKAPGPKGPKGDRGPAGPSNGAPGKDGKDGVDAQALPYGVALVQVKRGAGNFTSWASYSTTLGGPADTASGVFRFTCSTASAPCHVRVQGYATTDGVTVYPRVDITKQDFNSGAPLGNCEYADGTTNGGTSSDTLSTDSSAPTAMTLGIGGSSDCGIAGSGGTVDDIEVPAGFYDVASTFAFTS